MSEVAMKALYDKRGNKRKPKEEEGEMTRMHEVILNQLAVGKSRILRTYRQRVGETPDGTCPHCEEEEETTEHLLIYCPAHQSKRKWLDTEGLGVGVIRAQPEDTIKFLNKIGKIDSEKQIIIDEKKQNKDKRRRAEEEDKTQNSAKKQRGGGDESK